MGRTGEYTLINRIGARLSRLSVLALGLFVLNTAQSFAMIAKPAPDGSIYGAFGPEGARMREQLWMLPSGDPDRALRATVFRPADDRESGQVQKQRPLVVINHGTDEWTREAVSMPVYFWISRWFVERGYVVVLPQRRGHGATGGTLSESIGNCDKPDHHASGLVAAQDIAAVINFMTAQPFVEERNAIVVGMSTGGWASLALGSLNPEQVAGIVNFSGGRGGHAYGRTNEVCGANSLRDAAAKYGGTARIPSIWFYAENDSYFGPDLAKGLAAAWSKAGGPAELHVLAPYGMEGHNLADDRASWDLWGTTLDQFLRNAQSKARTEHAAAHENAIVTSEKIEAPIDEAR